MFHVREEAGPRTSRRFRAGLGRAVAVGAATAALLATVVLAPSATAAQPNHQACLGHDVRTYAGMGAGFGAFISGVADEGAGTEIQAHLAGLVPDQAIPNSCND
ncbi:hypothetical protein [Promicromonospora soli]